MARKKYIEPDDEPIKIIVCPICERAIPDSQLDKHHLIPKVKGGKETEFMHRMCHRQIHSIFSESELARKFNTVEKLLENEDMKTFVTWIKTKPDDFIVSTKMSSRRK